MLHSLCQLICHILFTALVAALKSHRSFESGQGQIINVLLTLKEIVPWMNNLGCAK
jgi:hypothetical protein